MSFLAPQTNLPEGLGDNTPGRQATQSPNTPVPLFFGPALLDVKWVTPVLHWTYRPSKAGNYAFFSCYGWVGLGPADYIRQIHINKKPYQGVYVHRSEVGDAPYVKTISKETPETFTFFWGTETEGSKNAHLNGLVRTADHAMKTAIYPADRGIFSVSLRDVEAGLVGQNGETPALPLVQIEVSRRSPKTYSFGHVDHGVNLAGAAYDLMTLTRGGAKIPTGLLGASWDAVIAKLDDTGVAGISGTDLFGAVVAAERQEVGEYLTEILGYFDGHVVERNGKLEIDYMAADDTTTDPDGLTVISEHQMGTGVDPVEDPDDQEDMPSHVTVTGLDLLADPPLQESSETASVPGASLILGEDRGGPTENRRFWVLRKQLKGAAQVLANQKALTQWRGTVPVLRQYAYQPDGTTPLLPGDRFDLDRADIELDLVVRITERTEDDTHVTFKVIGERGAFPRPYEPEPDPRADLTAQPPADLVRYAAAQLPPDLSDAADTRIAMLVERASNSTVGFDTYFAPTDSWPGQVIDTGNVRFAVAAVLQANLGATLDNVVPLFDTVGDDWSYLRSQSDLEAADDQLLAYHNGEWFSVGTILPLVGGEQSIALKRARLASLPAAHAIGDVFFFILRNDLISITHASFAEVEDESGYDLTTATKWFKLRPYTTVQGNLTAAFSLALRDPTPDQVTGLAVVMQGRAASLTWPAVLGALVDEYQVYRQTWNGSGWDDDGKIGETAGTFYPNLVPAYGDYRWRVIAVATDYTDGTFSDWVTGTAAPTGEADIDPAVVAAIVAAQAAADAAQEDADDAQNDATAALADLAEILSDGLLSPNEKPRVIRDRDVIVGEQAGIDAQASAYGITTQKTAYDNAVSALTAYLATLTTPVLWSNLADSTTVVGATFHGKFADVYTTRQTLLDEIAAAAKVLADTAQSTANAAEIAAAAAQDAADDAQNDATAALADLAEILSDGLLSIDEKPGIISERDVILADQTGIDAQATAYGITAEKTAYDNAVSALTVYLATLTTPVLWSNLTNSTSVDRVTFLAKFEDVYTTRQTLLNKIAARAGEQRTDVPSTPTVPVYHSQGTNLDDQGNARAWIQATMPAMPAGGTTLEALIREVGDTTWQIDEVNATPSAVHKFNGIAVGASVEIAARARSFDLVPSAVSTVLSRTAPGDSTTPSAPGSLSTSTDFGTHGNPPPKYDPANFTSYFAAWFFHGGPAEKDIDRIEVFANQSTGAPSNGDAIGKGDIYPASTLKIPIYVQVTFILNWHVYVRFWDRSGNKSTWADSGAITSSQAYTGNLGGQNADNVRLTGQRIGSASATKVLAVYDENPVVSLVGGSPSEWLAFNIAGYGFGTQADSGQATCATNDNIEATYSYDHGSNSSSAAYFLIKTKNGANLPAGIQRWNVRIIEKL